MSSPSSPRAQLPCPRFRVPAGCARAHRPRHRHCSTTSDRPRSTRPGATGAGVARVLRATGDPRRGRRRRSRSAFAPRGLTVGHSRCPGRGLGCALAGRASAPCASDGSSSRRRGTCRRISTATMRWSCHPAVDGIRNRTSRDDAVVPGLMQETDCGVGQVLDVGTGLRRARARRGGARGAAIGRGH